MKSKELSIICKKISVLLKSGCEITRSLSILSNHQSIKNKKIIKSIYNDIQRGNSITEAFEKSKTFTEFFINMIKVGEVTGNLDEIMEDLSEYYSNENQIKDRIKKILAYPSIVFISSLICMTFILIFIIPNFENIFTMNNVDPPWVTNILIKLSKIIRTNPYLIIGIMLLLIFLMIYVISSKKIGKRIKSKMILTLPYIRNISLTIATTRLCRTLEILVRSGINIIDAIDISSKVINNVIIQEKLDITKNNIRNGYNISYSMEQAKIFPKIFIAMIEIGEESGSLDYTLKVTNEFYTEELKSEMEQIAKLAEPALTVVIGLIVGIFIISMLVPMYDAMSIF